MARTRFFSKSTKPLVKRVSNPKRISEIFNPKKEYLKAIKKQEEKEETKLTTEEVLDMEPIFQIWRKLIILRNTKTGQLYAIDQHAAHERIRYTYFQGLFGFLKNEKLVDKFTSIHLKSEIHGTNHMEALKKEPKSEVIRVNLSNGLKIFFKKLKIFYLYNSNSGTLTLDSSYILLGMDIVQLIKDNTDFKGDTNMGEIWRLLDSRIRDHSCKGAAKFNDTLKGSQITRLVSDLKLCQFPLYCIHGRNTIHPISKPKNSPKNGLLALSGFSKAQERLTKTLKLTL